MALAGTVFFIFSLSVFGKTIIYLYVTLYSLHWFGRLGLNFEITGSWNSKDIVLFQHEIFLCTEISLVAYLDKIRFMLMVWVGD